MKMRLIAAAAMAALVVGAALVRLGESRKGKYGIAPRPAPQRATPPEVGASCEVLPPPAVEIEAPAPQEEPLALEGQAAQPPEETARSEASLPEEMWIHEGDGDGDGLNDEFERAQGLDPHKVDSFGDGVADEDRIGPTGESYFEMQRAEKGATERDEGEDRLEGRP